MLPSLKKGPLSRLGRAERVEIFALAAITASVIPLPASACGACGGVKINDGVPYAPLLLAPPRAPSAYEQLARHRSHSSHSSHSSGATGRYGSRNESSGYSDYTPSSSYSSPSYSSPSYSSPSYTAPSYTPPAPSPNPAMTQNQQSLATPAISPAMSGLTGASEPNKEEQEVSASLPAKTSTEAPNTPIEKGEIAPRRASTSSASTDRPADALPVRPVPQHKKSHPANSSARGGATGTHSIIERVD